MNTGKANATTPAQQAAVELKAKAQLKKKRGFSETKPSKGTTSTKINLDKIPVEFCPDKPISDCPESILNSKTTLGQRKHNGHCVFLVRGKKTTTVYSRRMEPLTDVCVKLPFIKEQLDLIPAGSFVLTEVTFYSNKLKKEVPRFVAQVIRNEDPEQAFKRYEELCKEGEFHCRPFDILFYNHKIVEEPRYVNRWALLSSMKLKNIVELIPWIGPNSSLVATAKKLGWEGFILRHPEKSQISFSMDGKAHRSGSYKFKFTAPGDFVVDEVLKGKSGKHSQFYSKFHIIEYSKDGAPVDRGYVGPGTLSHDELEQLTKDIDSGKRTVPFVVEVEYQSIHDETGKLEFGIIQRIREDKQPKECIVEE